MIKCASQRNVIQIEHNKLRIPEVFYRCMYLGRPICPPKNSSGENDVHLHFSPGVFFGVLCNIADFRVLWTVFRYLASRKLTTDFSG